MTTVRLQVVDAVATALESATRLTLWRNLDYALESENLPALVVISGEDKPDENPSPLGVLDQNVVIEIDVLLANSENPEAAADPYEAAIHAAMMASGFAGYGDLVRRLGGTWDFDLGDCAARRLAYRVGYRTAENNLET
ncbi:MAG: hypothetical protein HYY97_15845 [Rhodocyclales bacterium]|nr:hypothetical protein [Rhodocyclales bacterium]